ncbi:phage head closure protein [Planctomicrobium sp. SH527]|uniref:phage head closure protein n=1 Tax=Planctomicrobium sp. SH527 TaxID=3448123 RepID=UPI003F5B8C32
MAAGQYRHRIRIEAPQRTTNADGQQLTTWPTETDPPYLQIWANVQLVGAEQEEHHAQQQTHAVAVIKCRWTHKTRTITPGMRVRFRGAIYEISSSEDLDFRGIEIVIRATSIRSV